ncbi:hypothetical protein M9Y10_002001 [Tritrichomonas musculus]|uniref:tRNA-splicing endonuclease subunit Sen15 domain-containing protein n=1 Tax=Tritrichomonas musculus TaxID=1915356 RepID=A0ABR2L8I7_9EUKA
MAVTKEIIDEILEHSPKEQLLAVPTAFVFLLNQENLVYQKYEILTSGYIVLNCLFNEKLTSFLPILHDFQIKSSTYVEFLNIFKDRQKYIALTSSDGSVILYQISEAKLEVC